jgi:hypothetical protein
MAVNLPPEPDRKVDPAPLPRWKCHKIVEAIKIEHIFDDSRASVVRITGDGFEVLVDREYVAQHKPAVGGYFVRYKDGYKSFSPAEAFEDGYMRMPTLFGTGAGSTETPIPIGGTLDGTFAKLVREPEQIAPNDTALAKARDPRLGPSRNATADYISRMVCGQNGHRLCEERVIDGKVCEPFCIACGLKMSEIRAELDSKPFRRIDGKFGTTGDIIKVSNGEVLPLDEPLFLIRARDWLAVKLLETYWQISVDNGCNDYHFAGLGASLDAFRRFAIEHPERMKQPSITRGK